MYWLSRAPANIALIKYMGKKDESSNLPDNSSLSYTLNNLLSTVQLEQIKGNEDKWQPLSIPGAADLPLSVEGQNRFIKHLAGLKAYFAYEGGFLIKSSNNFPHSSGLASSASSFAALTQCAIQALSELTAQSLPSLEEQAQLSRNGSGSSCRSFYSPWALWQENEVRAIDLPYENLIHQVIVISSQEKKVSSSEAHKRVKSSVLYATRPERAEDNLNALLDALHAKDWVKAYHLCWAEFQDMHHLFSSCAQPFTYMTEHSLEVLAKLQNLWDTAGDGPIVTMDAGPNIHLLYRAEQIEMARQFAQSHLAGSYHVL